MSGPIFRYRNLSKRQRLITKDAVHFVIGKFCPRIQSRIQVKVRAIDGMLDRHWEYGHCTYIDDSPSMREFQIDIEKSLTMPTYIRTLMHELVHVKQHAKGEMKYYARSHKYIKWYNERIDADSLNYWELPWEIEAHGREEGLTQQFIQQYPQWESVCEREVI